MEYLIIFALSTSTATVFLLAFRYGLSLGQTVSKGELKPLKTPMKALREAKENKEAKESIDKDTAEFNAMLEYDKDKAYEGMKKANSL